MVNNIGMIRKVCLGVAASGLVLGAGVVSAEQFEATATINNTLAITDVQPMDFGELYVVSANANAIAGLTLAPDGGIAPAASIVVGGAAADAPLFFALTAGNPARGTVMAAQSFTLAVPNFPSSGLADGPGSFDSTAAIRLRGPNPSQPALYLTDFTVGDVAGGDVTFVSGGDWLVSPDFPSTEVTFAIGATIYTDGSAGVTASPKYAAGVYTGTFEVNASY